MDTSSLLNAILSNGATGKIAQKTGLDENQVGQIITTGLPVILGGMSKNTRSKSGADSLNSALDQHADSTVLDNPSDATHNAVLEEGTKILGNIFGSGSNSANSKVAKSTGLDAAAVGQVMAMVAPMVMAYLAKQKVSQSLNSDSLSSILSNLTSGTSGSKNGSSIIGIIQMILGLFKKN